MNFKILYAVFVVICMFVSGFTNAALIDTTAPELHDLTIIPGAIDVSNGAQTVGIQFEFSDELAGALDMGLYIYDPLGAQIGFTQAVLNPWSDDLVSGDAFAGVLETEFVIPQYAADGEYTYRFFSRDVNYNSADISYDELVNMGFGGQLMVTSSQQDTTAPELLGLTITPGAIDVSNGAQTVGIQFEFTDELAGALDMGLYIFDPSGAQVGYTAASINSDLVSGDAFAGVVETEFVVPQYAADGEHTYRFFSRDVNYNSADIYYDELVDMGFGGQLMVTSSQQDITAPELLGLTITPGVVDVSNGAQTVGIQFEFSDEIVGALDMGLHIFDPSGAQVGYTAASIASDLVSGDAFAGVLETEFVVPLYAADGEYTYRFFSRDVNYNNADISYEELVNIGFGGQLIVDNYTSVPEPPSIYLGLFFALALFRKRCKSITGSYK
jgi:hypothetical protein